MEAAVGGAVARARAGDGPTLVEAKTYRYAGHSRSDKATYRPEGELEMWLKRDPVALFGQKLVSEGLLDDPGLEQVRAEVGAALEATLERVVASPYPTDAQMLAQAAASQE